MVEPAPDDAERHSPDRDVGHGPGGTASIDPSASADPDRDEDPREDAQGVGADRQRAEVPDPLRGARDRGEEVGHDAGVEAMSFSRAAMSCSVADLTSVPLR